MADNCRDLYSKSYMMRSMTTITSSNGKINDQGGASTCLKLTYLRLLIPRLLLIVNVPIQPAGKSKAAPKAASALGRVSKAKASSSATWRTVETAPQPKQAPVTPPKKGGKDQGKGGKSLFTPWRRLEPSGILWMGIQMIKRSDLCIGPD